MVFKSPLNTTTVFYRSPLFNVADQLVSSNFLKVDEDSGEVSTAEEIDREDFVGDETVFYLNVLATEVDCSVDCQVEGTSVGILKVSAWKILMIIFGRHYGPVIGQRFHITEITFTKAGP